MCSVCISMKFYHAVTGPADGKLTLPYHWLHASIGTMQRTSAVIQAHTISPAGRPALCLKMDAGSRPAPGQPFMAYLHGSTDPVRTVLYPSRLHDDGFTSTAIPSAVWSVGSRVDLLGPIGKGFSPPARARRWFLIALDQPIDRLLPLVETAVASDINLAVFAGSPMPDLPLQVEIAADPAGVVDWADYIAIDTTADRLAEVSKLLLPPSGMLPAAQVQTLIDVTLPCGLGVCAACAVVSGKGWKLSCQDGPVFDMRGWGW